MSGTPDSRSAVEVNVVSEEIQLDARFFSVVSACLPTDEMPERTNSSRRLQIDSGKSSPKAVNRPPVAGREVKLIGQPEGRPFPAGDTGLAHHRLVRAADARRIGDVPMDELRVAGEARRCLTR
jgi:hypothetical protein